MQQKFATQRSCIVSAELGKRDTAAADAFTSFIKCFRQFLCIEMVLEQIIHRAVLQSSAYIFIIVIVAERDKLYMWVLLVQCLAQLKAVHSRHPHIRQHNIRSADRQFFQSFGTASGFAAQHIGIGARISGNLCFQNVFDIGAGQYFIVYNHHIHRYCSLFSFVMHGMESSTMVYRLGSLSIQSAPASPKRR